MATDDELGSAATMVGPPTQGTLTGAATATGAAAPPTLLAERYEIRGLIGVGGMGRVYRAHDRALDELVALKILRRELVGMPGMLERFRQEVKLARRVTSPHVVRTFDLGQHGEDHFLTMELVEGKSLAQLLDTGGALAIAEALRIARAAAAGIAAAHATGVLHRDLKPDNILVAATGRIALSDFGIARPSGAPTATTDRYAGTPAYMAPEQVEGAAEIGPAVDVYAFGAILFEMLAGRRPFPGSDAFAVALARLREPPPDPRAVRPVPDALAELVVRCLARAPADRLADGAALVAALDALGELAAVPEAPRLVPVVPEKGSRSVALLPLRAPAEMAEVADGLSEEIVDALTMTRGLRVRPLASVRAAQRGEADPRELGHALGVDVVVDGSIRKRGDRMRIAARAVGVADGFVLWASHLDAAPEGLLEASDELVRAIARALTVDLAMPARPERAARVAEAYLELKARLRVMWIEGELATLIADLERVIAEAPDDPGLVATLALALARSGYFGNDVHLARARGYADRAVALAPDSGDAWLALACACQFTDAVPDALRAMIQAVLRAPGLASVQAMLGSMLLELGVIDEAIAHLEAAQSLDPTVSQVIDLARAYIYTGRDAEAFALLARASKTGLRELTIARFKSWRGERYQLDPEPPGLRSDLARFVRPAAHVFATGTMTPDHASALEAAVTASRTRLRAGLAQFVAELALVSGDAARALDQIEIAVAAGLHDLPWIERCPLLAPLRDDPRFAAAAASVRQRVGRALAAISASR